MWVGLQPRTTTVNVSHDNQMDGWQYACATCLNDIPISLLMVDVKSWECNVAPWTCVWGDGLYLDCKIGLGQKARVGWPKAFF